MPRAPGHYLPREMAFLGLIECALSFAAIYAVIDTARVSVSPLVVFTGFAGNTIVLTSILTAVTGGVAVATGLYRPEVCLDSKRQLAAVLIVATVAFAGLFVAGAELPGSLIPGDVPFPAKALLAWLAAVSLIRLGYNSAVVCRPASRRVVVLGDAQHAAGIRSRLKCRRGRAFDAVVMDAGELCWTSLKEQRIWAVVLALTGNEAVVEPLLDCKLRGMRIIGSAAFQEEYLGRIDLDAITASDLLLGQGFSRGRASAAIKRTFDLSFAICMLVLALPLMVLTALAIKADSPGPIFYRQQRTGQFDKTFMLFKFRSMTADAEAGGTPRWAQQKDPRVTRVGRFIRATRIDELPQLANIIRGEMSLVGPRPERPHFVEQLERAIPFYRQRAYVKPGLTGWAQINFPYGASVEDAREKLSYDLHYVKNRTLALDLTILFSTIRVVLFQEGAR